MKPAAILAVVAAAVLALIAIGESSNPGAPQGEPAVIAGAEELLGTRVEDWVQPLMGRLHPGVAAPDLEGPAPLSPVAPKRVGRPRVLRDAPSQFDGDLRDLPDLPPPPPEPLREEAGPALAEIGAQAADPVVQRSATGATAPAGTVADGISSAAGVNALWPPDPVIDVGPQHVIEAVNTSWAVYDKSTRATLAANSFDALFTGTGTSCDDDNHGDPVVLYDTIGGRWILSDFAWTDYEQGPFYECIAVSQTGDPVTGGWWFYAYEMGQSPGDAPPSRGYLPDYPKLSIWPDGIYMTLNMFRNADEPTGTDWQWSNGRIVAFDRDALEAGVEAEAVGFDMSSASGNLLPANARVQTGLPAAGTPDYIAELWNDTTLRVWTFHVDWTHLENSTLSDGGPPATVAVAAYAFAPATATTPGAAIDTLNDRPMMQNQYTSIGGVESIWLTHTVDADDASARAAVRWYQLGVTGGTIAAEAVQQATWAPADTLNRFLPSLAIDRVGNLALGYSAVDASTPAGIRYAGRLADDAPGTFSQGERVLQAGGGTQAKLGRDGNPINRWGDYSAMTLDPSDGCTFWYVNEYYATTGDDWHTAIASFAYPSCLGAPGSSAAPVASSTGTAVGATLTTTNGTWTADPTSYRYQWQRGDGTSWTTLDGATASTYAAVAADAGASLRCVVTAANRVGSTAAASNAIGIAAPRAPALRAVSVPRPTRASLARGLAVTFTPPARSTVTIVVRAGGRVVGRIRTTVRDRRVTIRVPIRRTWREQARAGDALRIAISGVTSTGVRIPATSTSARLR